MVPTHMDMDMVPTHMLEPRLGQVGRLHWRHQERRLALLLTLTTTLTLTTDPDH